MIAEDIRNARAALGLKWGLGRPLAASEFGRLLRLRGRDPGESVLDWEAGTTPISGPVAIAVEYMLDTARKPSTFDRAINWAQTRPPTCAS